MNWKLSEPDNLNWFLIISIQKLYKEFTHKNCIKLNITWYIYFIVMLEALIIIKYPLIQISLNQRSYN